ncbi:MAG TPA: M20/M25/M40 family metallo-hydrolase, partial [bacterium]|nr:M20/M25/M40 family metallo-hydrolase [bacterium]
DEPSDLPLATPLGLRAHIEIDVESEDAPAMNVFAVLPGSDPQLADEYIVIGSHLDHLGTRGGRMFPGADDDGSGTTGVLAIAQMFANNPIKPRRSILFVCFAGEEMGLLGSRYFVENCPIPLESIAAELQMDMIGRSEEESRDGGRLVNRGETAADNKNVLHLVGTRKLSQALHETCMERNQTAGFDIEFDQESLFTRSDHANFAYQGVPIAFFFTGIHKDYHQTSDTPDKIEYPKLLRVARYVYDIAFTLAQSDERPLVDEDLWRAFKKTDRRGRMPAKPAAPLRR